MPSFTCTLKGVAVPEATSILEKAQTLRKLTKLPRGLR